MEYNNRVICGIFHVRTNFYENLEYVLGNLTSPLREVIFARRNFREFVFQIFFFISREEIFANQVFRDLSR